MSPPTETELANTPLTALPFCVINGPLEAWFVHGVALTLYRVRAQLQPQDRIRITIHAHPMTEMRKRLPQIGAIHLLADKPPPEDLRRWLLDLYQAMEPVVPKARAAIWVTIHIYDATRLLESYRAPWY